MRFLYLFKLKVLKEEIKEMIEIVILNPYNYRHNHQNGMVIK